MGVRGLCLSVEDVAIAFSLCEVFIPDERANEIRGATCEREREGDV